jgi:hypothetical protein
MSIAVPVSMESMQFGTEIMVAHYNALSGLTGGAMIMDGGHRDEGAFCA